MTALSEVTRYLDLPRHWDRAGHSSLDTDEVFEVRRQAAIIMARPRGDRLRALLLRQLAERFGVTTRTIYRYIRDDVQVGTVNGFEALFRITPGQPPRQMTAWRRLRRGEQPAR